MPLDYADFAHHYESAGMSDEQRREHFETLTNLLDCIVRLFWNDGSDSNKLGITLQENLQPGGGALASTPFIATPFNDAASY